MFENYKDWAISNQGSNRTRFKDYPVGAMHNRSTAQVSG